MRLLALAALVLAPLGARAEPPEGTLRGGWVARAGAAAFRGRWSAQRSANPATDAQGSWTLHGVADAIVLEGTWSARRDGRQWQGAWTARAATGAVFSGTWKTRMRGIAGKTFFDLLLHAKATRVAGTWRVGGTKMKGDFWLETG